MDFLSLKTGNYEISEFQGKMLKLIDGMILKVCHRRPDDDNKVLFSQAEVK
jgi:hypothetical protein